MLRINLLPAYIAEQKKTRVAWGMAIGMFVLLSAILPVYGLVVQQRDLDEATAKAEKAKTDADRVRGLQAEEQAVRAKIDPIQKKVQFVDNVRYFNRLPGRIYANTAKYTLKDVEYSGMAVSGDTLQITAFVQRLDDLGRFYLTLFANPDIKGLSIKPSWPSSQERTLGVTSQQVRSGFPVAVTAQLRNSVVPPEPPVALSGGGAGGPGMGGGGPMGMGSMMSGSMGGRMGGAPVASPGGGAGKMGDL